MVDNDALLEWARAHAPEPAAAPAFIYEIDELPLTAVGKVFKIPLIHDAIRHVVEEELTALDLCGWVAVDGDRVSVHLVEGSNPDCVLLLQDRLNRYAFGSVVEDGSGVHIQADARDAE